jgi:TetR/AcrR family fatty acid metabolism transcriptional regulator
MRSKSLPDVRVEPTFIEAARRAQLVRCAIDTIAELGYARASLAEIAKRAGISKSVISYYFAGKDELIAQVVVEVFTAAAAFMRPRVEAAATAPGKLRAYIESNLTFMRDHPAQMLAMTQIFAGSNTAEGLPGVDPSMLNQGEADLDRLLRWGQEAGEFRAFDTRVMATAIRNVIDGVPAQMAGDPHLDLDAYAGEVVTLFQHATRTDVSDA